MSTVLERWHMARVALLGCCVCRRIGWGATPGQVHHVAEGSSVRSNFAVANLCPEHHTGGTGFHEIKEADFCARFDVPMRCEYGLLVWTNEDLAEAYAP